MTNNANNPNLPKTDKKSEVKKQPEKKVEEKKQPEKQKKKEGQKKQPENKKKDEKKQEEDEKKQLEDKFIKMINDSQQISSGSRSNPILTFSSVYFSSTS